MLYVEWIEPFCFKENGPECLSVIQRMLVSDVIKWQRWREPRYLSDKDALDDFLVVHWAKVVGES